MFIRTHVSHALKFPAMESSRSIKHNKRRKEIRGTRHREDKQRSNSLGGEGRNTCTRSTHTHSVWQGEQRPTLHNSPTIKTNSGKSKLCTLGIWLQSYRAGKKKKNSEDLFQLLSAIQVCSAIKMAANLNATSHVRGRKLTTTSSTLVFGERKKKYHCWNHNGAHPTFISLPRF